MLSRYLRALTFFVLVMLASVSFASILKTALPGTDEWATQTGTFYNFGIRPGAPNGPALNIGVVQFVGLPIYPNGADTLIERLVDADINGAAIPIRMLALSWQSAAPVDVGGISYDVTAALDPAHLAEDVGTMSIMGSELGGTYISQLSVFVLFHFTPHGHPPNFDVLTDLVLDGFSTWVPKPSNIPDEVYFDPSVTVYDIGGGLGQIILDPVPTPEPGTLVLISVASLTLLGRAKAKLR